MVNEHERYKEARSLMDQGHLEEAASLFEQNVKSNPHFKDLELLGECLMRLGRLVDAIVPLAAATTLNKAARAPSLLAEVYFLLDEMHDADESAELALSRDASNRKALNVKEMILKKSAT
jgi:tetratricopeptide (TPR) repeat protein